jgi:uncharacterized tellurite resistance protein B-like protein
MLDLIKKVLGERGIKDTGAGDGGDEAHIALCVLLLEAAYADGKCSKEEMNKVVATLKNQYGVGRGELQALIDTASREREEAIDLFQFTRYLNQHYTQEQKMEAMESVWRIIHTDGRLEAHEDQYAHKLANLLRLTHKELIDTKIRARQQLK